MPRLVLRLTLITFIPILIFSIVGFLIAKSELQKFIEDRVASVNMQKAGQVESFFEKEIVPVGKKLSDDSEALQDVLTVATIAPTQTAYREASQRLTIKFGNEYLVDELEEVLFVKKDNTVAYAFSPVESTSIGKPVSETIQRIVQAGQNITSVPEVFSDNENHASVGISEPVNDAEGFPVGTLFYHYDFRPILDQVESSTGLSETGETYLMMKEDDQTILYLSALRYAPSDKPLTKRKRLNDDTKAASYQALTGNTGTGATHDYSGRSVIAAWQPLTIPNWGIVTKLDTSEGLSPIQGVQWMIIGILIVILAILVTVITLTVKQQVDRPLRILEQAAEDIDHNRYHHTDIDTKLLYSHDNFGKLATHLHNIIQRHTTHNHKPEDDRT